MTKPKRRRGIIHETVRDTPTSIRVDPIPAIESRPDDPADLDSLLAVIDNPPNDVVTVGAWIAAIKDARQPAGPKQ